MRQGNFFYELKMSEAFVVHRGVSQGGRMLMTSERRSFWQKHNQEVIGISIGDGKVIVSLSGLRVLREKNLVIVSNPGKPRVWTVKRILESAEKIQIMMEVAQGASQRRGGLKF